MSTALRAKPKTFPTFVSLEHPKSAGGGSSARANSRQLAKDIQPALERVVVDGV